MEEKNEKNPVVQQDSEIEQLEIGINHLTAILSQFQEAFSACQETLNDISSWSSRLAQRIKENTDQINKEIAEHKQIEGAIERGKREWESTFDAVTDMIILTDVDRTIIRCNISTCQYLENSYHDLIGRKIEAVFFNGTDSEARAFQIESKDVQFPTLPGWFDIASYPMLLEGSPYGIVYVIKDITERKKVQERLRENQEILRRINDELENKVKERTLELMRANQDLQREINDRKNIQAMLAQEKDFLAITLLSIRDGVITTDRDSNIVLFNKAAEIIMERKEQNVLGKPLSNVFLLLDGQSNDISSDPLVLLMGLRESHAPNTPFTLLTEDGQKKLITCSSALLRDKNDYLIGYVVVFDDVTEQVMLESQLALSQKMESIGQLAAGIAHEINTPMQYVGDNTYFLNDAFQSINGFLRIYDDIFQKLNEDHPPAPKLAEVNRFRKEGDIDYYLSEIPVAIKQSLDGIERVRKIVLAMKAFSHPTDKEKQLANINQAIETTVTISRNEWKYTADMELELDPNLPLIYCEIDKINQVILNMVINASQAIQDLLAQGGAERGKIIIKTSQLQDYVTITIRDTGVGIPSANLDRIFDLFFTTKEVGKGTGQGLTIVHNIVVNEHKGSIQVESEVGKGTTFTIRLPINEPVSQVEQDT